MAERRGATLRMLAPSARLQEIATGLVAGASLFGCAHRKRAAERS